MFIQLLASRPARERSAGGATANVTLHGLLLGTAVFATLTPRIDRTEPPRQQHVVYVPPAAPAPPAPQPPGIVSPAAAIENWIAPIIKFPVDLPARLPDIAGPPMQSGMDFPQLAPGAGWEIPGSHTRGLPPGATYLADHVEVQVSIADGSPMPKYPNLLRSSGIDGTARMRFVVDTLGRAEMATAVDVDATNPAFAFAIRSTLPRMRFVPAQVGGRPVRQLVELPVVFHVGR